MVQINLKPKIDQVLIPVGLVFFIFMEYDITPKPTKYKGRLYRSRLEARWSAFFDRMEWNFEYEPIDFKRWSPDFLLNGIKGNNVYIEVKPFFNDLVLKEFQLKLEYSGLLNYNNWDEEIISKNHYLLCTEIQTTFNPGRILFGHQVFKHNIPDDILFKYGYDISSEMYKWDGLLTDIGQGHSFRKWFIEPNQIEGRDLLFEWYESANDVMFLKP